MRRGGRRARPRSLHDSNRHNRPSHGSARPLAPGAVVVLLGALIAGGSCSAIRDVRASFERPAADDPTPAAATPAGPAAAPPAQEKFPLEGPELRVRLARAVESARISTEGPILASTPSAASIVTEVVGVATVTRRGASFVLTTDRTERTIVGPALDLAPSREGAMRLDGAAHPGRLVCIPRPDVSDRAFDVIEHVALERYLPGVVAAELFPNWSAAAYEAQAIAARSYAIHERSRRRAAGDSFDIENTAGADQAYNGAEASAAARRAVERTRGRVLTWQGSVLRAYYSSACGGRAGSARDTWPTTAGYEYNLAAPLQGAPREHACHGSANYAWTVTRTRADVAARLSAWGAANGHAVKDVRIVASITVARRNAAQRPAEFEVTDAQGRAFRIQADALRHALNSPAGKAAAPEGAARLRSGDVEPATQGDVIVFTGRGFGHGVGLCQFGAEGFALRGWSADRMLALFYPGAAVTGLY